MKTRYKVVKKRNRTSAVVHANSKYSLIYNPGQIVTAPEGSLGIFVFKYKRDAEHWMARIDRYWSPEPENRLMMIEVEPLIRGVRQRCMSNDATTAGLDNFYNVGDYHYTVTWVVPYGTYCHQSVKVLT